MAKYINEPTLTITAQTSTYVDYTCTITTARNSYYGMPVSTYPIAVVDHTGQARAYIGWPKYSSWKASWGTPDYKLRTGASISGPWGTANGMLLNDYSYSFQGRVELNRGDQRKKSITIEVGVKSKGSNDFGTTMKQFTLSTTEIPKPTINTDLKCTVDGPNESSRKITVSLNFTNPDNYYTAKLYMNNDLLASYTTSFTRDITVTEEMYQTNPVFKCIIWGKDGNNYGEKSSSVYVEPGGVGVTVKNSGNHSVSNMDFRNVNNKEIKEVWVKVNGKVYKTRK